MIATTFVDRQAQRFIITPMVSSYDEGQTAIFKVTTTGNLIAPGLEMQWLIDNEEDTTGSYDGFFVLDENTEATIEIGILEDYLTEGQETLNISIMEEQANQDGMAHESIYSPYNLDGIDVLADTSIIIIDTSTAYVLEGNIVSGDVTCFGSNNGHATIYMTEGVEPFTYQWRLFGNATIISNTDYAYGLSPGTYTVDVTDSRNIFRRFSVIIEESFTMIEVSSTSTTSQITITATGGDDSGYTYDLMTDPVVSHGPVSGSAAFPNLASGTGYQFRITDANKCQTWHFASTLASGPPVIQPGTLVMQPSCFGDTGTIGVILSGGQGALTYAWTPFTTNTNMNSNLLPGTHSLTVTDSIGQTDTGSWEIVEGIKITAIPTVDNTSISISSNAEVISWSDDDELTSFNRTGLTPNTTYYYTLDSGTCLRGPLSATTSCAAITGTLSMVSAPSCHDSSDGIVSFFTNYDTSYLTATFPEGLTQIGSNQYYTQFTGPAGTYEITMSGISGMECMGNVTETVQMFGPVAMSTGATVTSTTISLSASGGSGSYTYSWQDSGVVTAYRSGLSNSTVYYWTITDGCSTVSGQSTTSDSEIIYYEKYLTASGKFLAGDFCPEPSWGAYMMQNSVWVDKPHLVGLLGKIIRSPQTLGLGKGNDTDIAYTPMDGNNLVWLISEIPEGDTTGYVLFNPAGGQKWIRINSVGEVTAEGTMDPCYIGPPPKEGIGPVLPE